MTTHDLAFRDIRGSLVSFCCSWHICIVCFPEFRNTWYLCCCFSTVSITACRWWCFLSAGSTHALWICQELWNQTEDKASLNWDTDLKVAVKKNSRIKQKSVFKVDMLCKQQRLELKGNRQLSLDYLKMIIIKTSSQLSFLATEFSFLWPVRPKG